MNKPMDRLLRGRTDGCSAGIDGQDEAPGGIMALLCPAAAIRGGEALDGGRATAYGPIAASQPNGGHLG